MRNSFKRKSRKATQISDVCGKQLHYAVDKLSTCKRQSQIKKLRTTLILISRRTKKAPEGAFFPD
jgi:hypothetical protein